MTITIGIMCFILSLVLFMQFRSVKEADITNIKLKREDELQEDLADWKEKYEDTVAKLEDTRNKINEYKQKAENNQETSELLNQELNQTNISLGKTDVEGEGVIIVLQDKEKEVTASDLLDLVNELKQAGAEAISINDQRVTSLTDIVDVEEYTYINMERTYSPFTVKVIGNRKYLEAGLTAKGGFVDSMEKNGKTAVVTGENNVQIFKYNKEFKTKSMKIES